MCRACAAGQKPCVVASIDRIPEGATMNKIIVIGHLGRDPEMRYTPGGQGVANFSPQMIKLQLRHDRFGTSSCNRENR